MRRTITAAATAALALGLIAGPAAAKGGPPAVDGSIVDTAVALNSGALADGAFAGTFDELIFAVSALGLADTLDTKRQFTVFAPTDAAFAALALELGVTDGNENGIVANGLVADDLVAATSAEYITEVLKYHVAPGERFAADIIEGSQVNTLLKGSKISVSVIGEDVFLDEAKVIVPNVETSNGVIHAIDAVLVP